MAGSKPLSPFADLAVAGGRIPDEIKITIFKYAGREACAAFKIACGSRDQAKVADEGMLYEPFTYWDWQLPNEWHSWDTHLEHRGWVGQDEEECRSHFLPHWKRRLLWERERPFGVNDDWIRYPNPKLRWEAFKRLINDDNRQMVKRIAVCYWMTYQDIAWIAVNLPRLEALDLSDATHYGRFSEDDDYDEVLRNSPSWTDLLLRNTSIGRPRLSIFNPNQQDSEDDRAMTKMLKRLKWLGIPDPRMYDQDDYSGHPLNNLRQAIMDQVVPQCDSLKTLSIRGSHKWDEDIKMSECPHASVCALILSIQRRVPEKVDTIELRLYITFMKYFLEKLSNLKPHIKRVGIDLGAWVQTYPIMAGLESSEQDMGDDRLAIRAAKKSQSDAYQEEHEKVLPISARWRIPDRDYGVTGYRRYTWCDNEEYYHRTKLPNFYCHDEGTDRSNMIQLITHDDDYEPPGEIASCPLDTSQRHQNTKAMLADVMADTLGGLFRNLHAARHREEANGDPTISHNGAKLFALRPEPQQRSLDPINPLALIQAKNRGYVDNTGSLSNTRPEEVAEVYPWLEKTFRWRPIFDWDWFMVPDTMGMRAEYAFYDVTVDQDWTKESENAKKAIQYHFAKMKDADIPVHLLIGRRNVELSNCYWGWPYNEAAWNRWLEKDFDANLDEIAGLIDVLSIYYDLRNPLYSDRLDEIQGIDPHIGPHGKCPQLLCPWKETGNCPFEHQRLPQHHQDSRIPDTARRQKMANKRALQPTKPRTPKGSDRLANYSVFLPPVGENANDHLSDDSNSDDLPPSSQRSKLLHLARKAAFTREAVGWQRFWGKYALKLSSLSQLHIRMPQCFDRIGSWRLAKLLHPNYGWSMLTYTDERQYIQTSEDLVARLPNTDRPVYSHYPLSKVWPAGRFVRRSWVREKRKLNFKESGIRVKHYEDGRPDVHFRRVTFVVEDWPNCAERVLSEKDSDEMQAGENEEFEKAKKAAKLAAEKERSYQHAHTSNEIRSNWHQTRYTRGSSILENRSRNTVRLRFRNHILDCLEDLDRQQIHLFGMMAAKLQEVEESQGEERATHEDQLRDYAAEWTLMRNTHENLTRRMHFHNPWDSRFHEELPQKNYWEYFDEETSRPDGAFKVRPNLTEIRRLLSPRTNQGADNMPSQGPTKSTPALVPSAERPSAPAAVGQPKQPSTGPMPPKVGPEPSSVVQTSKIGTILNEILEVSDSAADPQTVPGQQQAAPAQQPSPVQQAFTAQQIPPIPSDSWKVRDESDDGAGVKEQPQPRETTGTQIDSSIQPPSTTSLVGSSLGGSSSAGGVNNDQPPPGPSRSAISTQTRTMKRKAVRVSLPEETEDLPPRKTRRKASSQQAENTGNDRESMIEHDDTLVAANSAVSTSAPGKAQRGALESSLKATSKTTVTNTKRKRTEIETEIKQAEVSTSEKAQKAATPAAVAQHAPEPPVEPAAEGREADGPPIKSPRKTASKTQATGTKRKASGTTQEEVASDEPARKRTARGKQKDTAYVDEPPSEDEDKVEGSEGEPEDDDKKGKKKRGGKRASRAEFVPPKGPDDEDDDDKDDEDEDSKKKKRKKRASGAEFVPLKGSDDEDDDEDGADVTRGRGRGRGRGSRRPRGGRGSRGRRGGRGGGATGAGASAADRSTGTGARGGRARGGRGRGRGAGGAEAGDGDAEPSTTKGSGKDRKKKAAEQETTSPIARRTRQKTKVNYKEVSTDDV